MTSGIYKIEWPSGHYYIGKSDNIDRRWKQHQSSFINRKHTKGMQARYDAEGEPFYSIICEVHADHIDLIEGALIERHINNQLCLNATKGRPVSDIDSYTLGSHLEILKKSTAEHIRYMESLIDDTVCNEKKAKIANYELEKLHKEGVRIPSEQLELERELKEGLEYYTEQYNLAKDKIDRLLKRNLFQRIFNTKV